MTPEGIARQALGPLDLVVVGAYLAAVLGLSLWLAWRQRTGADYFLAGRSMGPVPLAFSIMANQASAVSLVGAPAFVALRPNGGLRWLQYELAVPLAMLALIVWLLPLLRSASGSSIYETIETRFGTGTRQAVAGAFLLSRGLALGVILYASALVVSECLNWPIERSLLVVGLFSVAYTSLGGIVADIWSDVIQLVLLWGGTIVAATYVLWQYGDPLLAAIPADRVAALNFRGGGFAETFSFWPMLLGGFFLYLSYYGCDQSQAQRLLAARNDAAARRSLALNGVLRFPMVLSYCLFGLLLAGLLQVDPGLSAAMAGRKADSLVPVFMIQVLPDGFRGILLAAILAAAMSSIDSALNSLAAVTLEDVLRRDPTRRSVWLGRLVSMIWGLVAVVSGFFFARSGSGILELVNQVGSAFYGPLLAVFALAVFTRGVGGPAATTGMAAGLAANLMVGRFAPGVSWLWWNVIGFAVAFGVALVPTRPRFRAPAVSWPGSSTRWLLAATAVILGSLAAFTGLN